MKKLLVAVFACVAIATPVQAEDHGHMHELLFGTTAGKIGFGNSVIDGNLNVGYNYQFTPGIQFSVIGNVSMSDTSGTMTFNAGIRGGFTLNVPMESNIEEAIFIFANAGVEQSAFAFEAGLGKRFKLTEHVAYRPSLSIDNMTASNIRFYINLLSFSAIW